MTLRTHRAGYVSMKQNKNGNIQFFGMTLPIFQLGDTVRPGMDVAEIPDLKNWELRREDRRTGPRASGPGRESRDHHHRRAG